MVVVLAALFAAAGAVGAQAQTAAGPVLRLPPAEVLGSAASADAAPRIIGGEDQNLCVSVDIAGERAGYLDCAGMALEAAAASARRQAVAVRDIAVAGAGSPDIEVGVASRSGTRLRLRENFGVSVRPPAAAAPAVPPTVGSRQ